MTAASAALGRLSEAALAWRGALAGAAFLGALFVAVFAAPLAALLPALLAATRPPAVTVLAAAAAAPAATLRGGYLDGANSKLTLPASASQASMALKARRVREETNLSSMSVLPVASSFCICARSTGCCKMICPLLKSQLGVG